MVYNISKKSYPKNKKKTKQNSEMAFRVLSYRLTVFFSFFNNVSGRN